MLAVSNLTGFGAGGGEPLVATFQSSADAVVVTTVATYTNAPIGTAASDRVVIAGFTADTNLVGATWSCKIGGSAATQLVIYEDSNEMYSGLYILRVSTGTTATIEMTCSGNIGTQIRIHVWSMTGLISLTPTSTASGRTTASVPLTLNASLTTANNSTFAVVNSASATTFSWTNITERSDANIGLSTHSAASSGPLAIQTLGVTATPLTSGGAFVVASFSQ